ncbi:IclR family transcriptional regulator [Sphingomonas sp. M1-B02]|uniref:IclR family transcriptional regulator n=1 Tax=Sphingomonas sp. M1-B02 TaxID=3114300 RepID=UPI00223FACB0|nr:IclR family transcriptional regulator [Sphingomonas sp. S6-11]UZK67326.1 IclR family transcriptional regulator [Sphingomonas sp. S6-11]
MDVGRHGARTLERGLDLLERVVGEPMNVHDLAGQAGLGLSTTRRLVASLVDKGFLTINHNRVFLAGPKLLELGARGRDQLDLVNVARPYLKILSAATGTPSFLGERFHDESVHLHCEPGTQRVRVSTSVGARSSLPETSLGRALLLDDSDDEWQRLFAKAAPEHRAPGWKQAMRAAHAEGLIVFDSPSSDRTRAVAAPVRDALGTIIAAISIVGAMQYVDESELDRIGPLVRDAAEAISFQLGYARGK